MNWGKILKQVSIWWENDPVFIKVYNERNREFDVYEVKKVELDHGMNQILLIAGDKINRYNLKP